MGNTFQLTAVARAAIVVSWIVLPSLVAHAQDGDGAIGELLTQVLPDVGFQFAPGVAPPSSDGAEPPISGNDLLDDFPVIDPVDNFTGGPPGIDGSDIMPIRGGAFGFYPQHFFDDNSIVDSSFRLRENAGDIAPLNEDGFVRVISQFIMPETLDELFGYAVGVPDTFGEPGPPGDVSTLPGFDQLVPDAQIHLQTVVDNEWPFSPLRPRGWVNDELFGDESPFACGDRGSHFVFCDAGDQGGSQFELGATFVALELPAPIDSMGAPYTVEVVFSFDDGTSQVYQGSFPHDLFNGSNQNFILRFDGNGIAFDHQAFNGSGWQSAPTGARIVNAGGGIVLVLDASIQPAGIRISTFKNTGASSPGNVISYSLPGADQPLDPFESMGLITVPGTGLPAFVGLDDPTLFANPDGVFVVETPEEPVAPVAPVETTVASATTSAPSAPSSEGVVTGSVNDESTLAPTTTESTGGSSNTTEIVLTLIGGTGLAYGAYYGYGRMKRRNEEQTAAGPPSVEFDPPPPVAAPAPPREELDFMGAFLTAFGGIPDGTPVATGAPEHLVESDWHAALHAEKTAQQRIEAAVTEAFTGTDGTGGLYGFFKTYLDATDAYQVSFTRTLSATTELQGMLTEWAEVQQIAAKQDLALAILQVGYGGFSFSRWINAPARVPWATSSLTGRMAASAPARLQLASGLGTSGALRTGEAVVTAEGATARGTAATTRGTAATRGGAGASTTTRAGAETVAGAPGPAVRFPGTRPPAAADDIVAQIDEMGPLPPLSVLNDPYAHAMWKAEVLCRWLGTRATPMEGFHSTFIHGAEAGSGFGFVLANGTPVAVSRVARIIRSARNYVPGKPVRLVSCHSASNGSASALARELNTWVLAPTHEISAWGNGVVAFAGREQQLGAAWIMFDPRGVARFRVYADGTKIAIGSGL